MRSEQFGLTLSQPAHGGRVSVSSKGEPGEGLGGGSLPRFAAVGVWEGDAVLAVDGQDVEGMSAEEVCAMMEQQGSRGTHQTPTSSQVERQPDMRCCCC